MKVYGELEVAQFENVADYTAIPASGKVAGRVVLDVATKKFYGYDSVQWTEFGGGGGSGGINYIDNFNLETNLDGWWETDSGAVSVPTNSALTQTYTVLTRVTSGQLRDAASLSFANGSADKQGFSAVAPFTLQAADFSQPLRVAFDFSDSAAVADGTYRVYLAHSSDAFASDFNLIELVPRDVAAGTGKYEGFGQAHYSNTAYRLYIINTSSSASDLTLTIDNVQVGPAAAYQASPEIAIEYHSNSSEFITANVTNITFSTKVKDTGGLWDGAIFTFISS